MNGGSAAVLTLTGRVVARDNVALRKHIEQLMGGDAPLKAIDLTDIAYIDSYALGQIIYYCNSARGRHTTVYIVNKKGNGNSYIDKLIDVSDLKQVFSIVDSLDRIAPAAPASGA